MGFSRTSLTTLKKKLCPPVGFELVFSLAEENVMISDVLIPTQPRKALTGKRNLIVPLSEFLPVIDS